MDPDATLKQLRAFSKEVLDWDGNLPSAGTDLAHVFQALDKWILDGGFLPQDWDRRGKDLL